MRWLYKVFFLGGTAYLLMLIERHTQKPNQEAELDQDAELLLIDEIGFEPEFARLIELLELRLLIEVRIVGGAKGKTVSIETDDELIAQLSFHKDRKIVVRLIDYQYGLQVWFSAAFPWYKVRFQPLEPVATTKKRRIKKNKSPRGR